MDKTEPRLQFLDTVRGVASLSVLIQHTLERSSSRYAAWSLSYFNLGSFGVVAFFLVSGFIIPYSLERSRSIMRFWVNRFFRLYPLYWLSLAAVLLCWRYANYPMPAAFIAHPVQVFLANATMLQGFVQVPDLLAVYWTLTLELAFYFLCSLLFAIGALHKSFLLAVSAALLNIALATIPAFYLHRSIPEGRVGLLVTAFLGTLLFRYMRRGVTRRQMVSCLIVVGLSLVTGLWTRFELYPVHADGYAFTGVLMTWTGAYLLFGVLFYLREKEFPTVLTWLGKISFSLYLVHGLMLFFLPNLNIVNVLLLELLISIPLSAATYHFVEKPCMAFHRHRSRPAMPSTQVSGMI